MSSTHYERTACSPNVWHVVHWYKWWEFPLRFAHHLHQLRKEEMLKVNGHEVPEHTSYSSLTTWLSCGYQYYLTRIRKVKEEPAVWSLGGSAVHLATENFDKQLWELEQR